MKVNHAENKPYVLAHKSVVWNGEKEKLIRDLICSGQSLPNALIKAAPEGFVKKLRKDRQNNRKKASDTKNKRPLRISRREQIEQLADELGIKPTDAMFRKLPGSFEGSKQRQ